MKYRYHADMYDLFPFPLPRDLFGAHKNELRVGFNCQTISSKFEIPMSFT